MTLANSKGVLFYPNCWGAILPQGVLGCYSTPRGAGVLFYPKGCWGAILPRVVQCIPHSSSRVCAAGHLKDPLPLIEKSRASCPSGSFPHSFIHQVIINTGLTLNTTNVLALKMALDADRA